MTRIRIALVVVVLSLLGAQMVPVSAAPKDPRAARDQARDRKAQLAKELDGLNASEDDLLTGIATLDEQVDAQSGEVDAARQAVAAAEGEVAEAEQAMAETQSRMTGLSEAVRARAVESFIRPSGDSLDSVVQSSDIAEVARKQALLDQVTANDTDVIDQLKAAREDFALRQAQAAGATAKADERRVQSEAKLSELEATRADQARLAAALDTRQAELSAEIEEQAKGEAELNRLIKEGEARAAAQRSSSVGAVGGSANLSPGAGGCIWPTNGTVTSGFGNRSGRLHAGIDIAGPIGTPIWATKDGTVIFAGTQSGYGNVVILSHGGGLTTLYAHQSRLAAGNGAQVRQGEVIGFVGNTGRSTGPHVHFETRYGDSPRDPRGCLA